MNCRNPSCGREIVQGQDHAETPEWFAKRLASGYCRPRCKKTAAPVRASRPLPSLEVVSWNHERGEGVAQPKTHTVRDKRFLKWLLPRPCELAVKGGFGPCLGQHIYHHTSGGGISLKGPDYEAITTCFGHHELFDNASKKGVGIFTEQELKQIIARNQMEYVAEGNKLRRQ